MDSGLLYRWEEFGDVLNNKIEDVGKGAQAIIGFRHETEVHDGTFDVTEQVRIFDPNGNRIGHQTFDDEQLASGDGPQEWAHALYFDTSNWDLGQHNYEILIRDNVTNKLSEPATGFFHVNEPLGPKVASLRSVDAPDTVAVGEDYSIKLNFGNSSSRDGSVVSTLSAKYAGDRQWYTYSDTKIWANIPAGGQNYWESTAISFDNTGTIQYRLDALNETWDVEVTSN